MAAPMCSEAHSVRRAVTLNLDGSCGVKAKIVPTNGWVMLGTLVWVFGFLWMLDSWLMQRT
jgi:hypothetical protein